MEIGLPVIGGDPNDVLFIDSAGNLAQDDGFTYDNTTGDFQAGNSGTGDIGVLSQPSTGDYGIGDTQNNKNNTSVTINDNKGQTNVNGYKSISYDVVPFTGTGLDDLTWGGAYDGTRNNNYTVWIDSLGTPDTFAWQDTLGNSGSAIAIDGTEQAVGAFGITVQFGATTGHDLGSVSAAWEEDISVVYGRIALFDGQHHTASIGDVDGNSNGTQLNIDDDNFKSGVTNRWMGGMTTRVSIVSGGVLTVDRTGNKTHFRAGDVTQILQDNWTDGSEIVLINDIATKYHQNVIGAVGTSPILLAGSAEFDAPINSRITLMFDQAQNTGSGGWIELNRTTP